jgi:ABC-type transport system involved in multi-copper enzyme maturation permease subunit
MTVYGLDYRPKPYEPSSSLARLRSLAASEFRALFRSKWGIVLFGLCTVPTLFRLVIMLIYLGALGFGGDNIRRGMREAPEPVLDFLPSSPSFYIEPIVAPEQGMLVLMMLMALATARTIAKDRATNALELYWTRGISPIGYFLGKWAGALLLVAQLTVAAPVGLWLVGVVFADDWSFLHETAPFMPRVVLGLCVFTAVLGSICVLISAVCSTANLATILWCMLLGSTFAAANVLEELLRVDMTSWASVWDAAATLARGCAGTRATAVTFEHGLPRMEEVRGNIPAAAAMLGGLALLLAALARRRLRIVEAIG